MAGEPGPPPHKLQGHDTIDFIALSTLCVGGEALGAWLEAIGMSRVTRSDTVGRGDRQYLTRPRANGTWYCVVEVPRPLQEKLGAKRLIRSLKTLELREAQDRRWAVLAELKSQISDARNQVERADEDLVQEALEVRKAMIDARSDDAREMLREAVGARIDALNYKYAKPRYHPETGEEQEPIAPEALHYAAVASGDAAPLDAYVDRWLSATSYTERTKADARTALADLGAWLKASEKPCIINIVDERLASDFRDFGLRGKGVHPKTANKKLSALRQYWAWMASSGFHKPDGNPWAGKSLPKPKAFQSDPDGALGQERPFTDEEIKALLSGPASADLTDVMRIAALSGMRLEEVGQLRVKNCVGGLFDVVRSKTKAGVRKVPIHPDLQAIVDRRAKGGEATAFLFPDFKASGWDDTRTMATSKQFAAYRRKVGVDDSRDGARRSKVNFHSFRRWFARKCEEAGQSETIVARVMGHEKGLSMTFSLYSQAMPLDLMRACVESVKLPVVEIEASN